MPHTCRNIELHTLLLLRSTTHKGGPSGKKHILHRLARRDRKGLLCLDFANCQEKHSKEWSPRLPRIKALRAHTRAKLLLGSTRARIQVAHPPGWLLLRRPGSSAGRAPACRRSRRICARSVGQSQGGSAKLRLAWKK